MNNVKFDQLMETFKKYIEEHENRENTWLETKPGEFLKKPWGFYGNHVNLCGQDRLYYAENMTLLYYKKVIAELVEAKEQLSTEFSTLKTLFDEQQVELKHKNAKIWELEDKLL